MADIVLKEQELQNEAVTIFERANQIVISDQSSYDLATSFLLERLLPFRKKWTAYWAPLRETAWSAYKTVQNKFKEIDDPAEMAERTIKQRIRVFDDEQLRIERERQRKAQEEAEKEAAEQRLRAAIVAEESGASEAEVSAIVDTPMAVVAEPVQPAYLRGSGISRRSNWKAKVNDLSALVKAAAKDKSLLAYLEPNQRALDARAKADRDTLNIPGVVPYDEAVVSARGR